MKKIVNEIHGEGYLYEHTLSKKTSKKGVDYIGGSLSIATDEECTNIIKFEFPYVVPVYAKSGKPNATYKLFENIINNANCTVMSGGKDSAIKLRVDSSIALNEWYDNEDKLVSNMRNEGGFVNNAQKLNDDINKRNTFKTDILISGVFRKEADEENGVPEKAVIKGATFNFTGALLPISFTVYNPSAIDYFENLEPSTSKPVFTKVWGNIVSQEIIKKIETENAFGDTLVEDRTSTRREYVITGASSVPYEWDSEDTITASELKEAMAAREVHLAEIKKGQEERAAAKAGDVAPAVNVSASASDVEFKF